MESLWNNSKSIKPLRIAEILYLFMFTLSSYLLLISRTGEAHTVWEVLHPLFIPTLFLTTSLLLIVILASEKVEYKLLLVFSYSILVHSFFSIVFPAGDLSGQQIALGRTRTIFDNAVFHGWTPWPGGNLQSRVYEWFRGAAFQASISVVFARMFSIDILWVHLFLVPILWGVFTPFAVFLVTKTISASNKVAVLASLVVSAFPYATYFGAISVPNSLGYIFLFYAIYFMLKNLDSNDTKTKVLMLSFSFFSFLSHFLTGVISFSLLILTLAIKSYKSEKAPSRTAKFSLGMSFLLSTSVLPLSFIYLRIFNPAYNTVFTLDKLYELPVGEIVGLFFLGELTYGFDLRTMLLIVIGSVIALLYMIFLVYNLKRNSNAKFRAHILFLFVAFLIILIDYRILKLFMTGLPLNEERLWVFQDFIAAPFVALAICTLFLSLKRFFKAHSIAPITTANSKRLSRGSIFGVLSLILNILIPVLLAGWITFSLSAAYPQIAPLQTTWYELEAVKYIEENTHEKYVVIGDVWTIYAGEVIVGINNPRAYYFLESNRTGHDLFVNMSRNPSPQWMLSAMNHTDTSQAYFVFTESRVGTEEFSNIVARVQDTPLSLFYVSQNKKLYVYSYSNSTNPNPQ